MAESRIRTMLDTDNQGETSDMALHLVIEPAPGQERIVRDSAESALRDAESYGSVTHWHWGEPQGNGQSRGVDITSMVDEFKDRIADVLEGAAESIRP